jgi:hypothetical protein
MLTYAKQVIVGVAQALQAIHSKRVVVCNLEASKVVKYGKVSYAHVC